MKKMAPGQILEASGLPEDSFPREYFRRALLRGRLSHAYLFVGPEGSCRRRFARELAKAIFCKRGMPCGACPPCHSVDHGNHPSFHVYSTGEGKASIEIADARDIGEKVHFRRSDFLVAIVENADRMTLPAANAFLKTLEEPTGKSLLILIAASVGLLLPTIVSRCHRISFPDPGIDPVTAPPEGTGAGSGPALEDLGKPDFHSRWDVREWVGAIQPEASSFRESIRCILDDLIQRERRCLPGEFGGEESIRIQDRLEALMELRSDLDRNVSPDLILEGAIRLQRGRL